MKVCHRSLGRAVLPASVSETLSLSLSSVEGRRMRAVDACTQSGEIGGVIRGEGLTWSHLTAVGANHRRRPSSPRALYRILDDLGQVSERRNQLRHPAYAEPERFTTVPNQV